MVINGKIISQEILERLKQEVAKLPFQPLFVDVVVGDDPVIKSYVATKARAAESIGIKFIQPQYPSSTTSWELFEKIFELNKMQNLCGLIIQLPLPAHIERQKILDGIDPRFDVDSLGSINGKLFYEGRPAFVPPTAGAIIHILDSLKQDLSEKEILVIGQGDLVGKPVTHLLKQRGFRVQTSDDRTKNLQELLKVSDVVISGTGHARLITGEMVKKGSIIIDAGTAESGGGIVGDVDFESVKEKAGFISPVPGGVGPVTVAKLLENVCMAAKRLVD